MFDVDCRLYNSLAGDVVWLWCFLVVGRRTGRFSVKFIPLGSSTKSTYLILRECIRQRSFNFKTRNQNLKLVTLESVLIL